MGNPTLLGWVLLIRPSGTLQFSAALGLAVSLKTGSLSSSIAGVAVVVSRGTDRFSPGIMLISNKAKTISETIVAEVKLIRSLREEKNVNLCCFSKVETGAMDSGFTLTSPVHLLPSQYLSISEVEDFLYHPGENCSPMFLFKMPPALSYVVFNKFPIKLCSLH
jgi:hypothetical protein